MHVPRMSPGHPRARRDFAEDSIEKRSPGLIGDLGSIIGGIVTPLVGGPHSKTKPKDSTPTTTKQHGNSPATTTPAVSHTTNTPAVVPPVVTPTPGQVGTPGTSKTDTSVPTMATPSDGNPSVPTQIPTQIPTQTPTPAPSSSSNGTTSGNSEGDVPPPLANVSADPNLNVGTGGSGGEGGGGGGGGGGGKGGGGHSRSVYTISGVVYTAPASSPTGYGTGGHGGETGSGSSPTNGHHLSTGALAGILVLCFLVFLGLFIFFIRKRSIIRRSEQRLAWWSRRTDNVATSPDEKSRDVPIRARSSVRSSFATAVDYALSPQISNPGQFPLPLPPVMGNGAGTQGVSPTQEQQAFLISLDNPIATPPPAIAPRLSTQSVTGSADSHAQYLYVVSDLFADGGETATPMSVRPFSPSESFSFPKPPQEQGSDRSSSRPVSHVPTVNSDRTVRQLVFPTTLAAAGAAVDPFGDPTVTYLDAAATSPSPPPIVNQVEIVQRPFVPTRPDELSVWTADHVKVLRIFDDGWVMVEAMPESGRETPPVGLIPLDCFRPPGQDLPSFFSERRVSSTSYSEGGEPHAGMAV